ncbi:MAG: hypothetical protein R6X35_05915 [Candidatus Krumholzibacteriia bacterium]
MRRVESLLDRVTGRGDASRDGRRREPWTGARNLDLQRDRETFDRLVALDFDYLMGLPLAAPVRILADLLPQSVLGRAQNGHGWFTDEFGTSLRFPDATFDRVLTVLERGDPGLQGLRVRRRRGELLSRFGTWLLARLDRPELELVVDGQPLLGIDFVAATKVDTRAFLTGLVLAGCMDDWSWRRTTMQLHRATYGGTPLQIGGGEIMIVDREKFDLCGLGDTGAVEFDDEQLRTLRDIGVICRDPDAAYAFPAHDQAFFRRRLGDGVCDDMAMVWVGANHGWAGLMGAFVMDAVDTYDKFLLDLTWGGYDGWLARQVQEHFRRTEGRPLVGDREILDLIAFAAKRNDPPVSFSSSHRRLIQTEQGSAVPTLLNHWRFLQGEPVFDIQLGFSRVPAKVFYTAARARLQAAGLDAREPEWTVVRTRRR